MNKTFPTPAPVDLVVRNAAGVIHVAAEDTDTSTVEVTAMDSSAEPKIRSHSQPSRSIALFMPNSGFHRDGVKYVMLSPWIAIPNGVPLSTSSVAGPGPASPKITESEFAVQ